MIIEFEDNFGTVGESIDGLFGVHLGSFGVYFRLFGQNVRVHLESMLGSGSDSSFRPPQDQTSRPLGPFLALLLNRMLAPCWPNVESSWASLGILVRSWSALEFILRPCFINMEHQTNRRGWIFEKLATKTHRVSPMFFKVPSIDFGSSLGHLGGQFIVVVTVWTAGQPVFFSFVCTACTV